MKFILQGQWSRHGVFFHPACGHGGLILLILYMHIGKNERERERERERHTHTHTHTQTQTQRDTERNPIVASLFY